MKELLIIFLFICIGVAIYFFVTGASTDTGTSTGSTGASTGSTSGTTGSTGSSGTTGTINVGSASGSGTIGTSTGSTGTTGSIRSTGSTSSSGSTGSTGTTDMSVNFTRHKASKPSSYKIMYIDENGKPVPHVSGTPNEKYVLPKSKYTEAQAMAIAYSNMYCVGLLELATGYNMLCEAKTTALVTHPYDLLMKKSFVRSVTDILTKGFVAIPNKDVGTQYGLMGNVYGSLAMITDACLNNPQCVAFDTTGNLYYKLPPMTSLVYTSNTTTTIYHKVNYFPPAITFQRIDGCLGGRNSENDAGSSNMIRKSIWSVNDPRIIQDVLETPGCVGYDSLGYLRSSIIPANERKLVSGAYTMIIAGYDNAETQKAEALYKEYTGKDMDNATLLWAPEAAVKAVPHNPNEMIAMCANPGTVWPSTLNPGQTNVPYGGGCKGIMFNKDAKARTYLLNSNAAESRFYNGQYTAFLPRSQWYK